MYCMRSNQQTNKHNMQIAMLTYDIAMGKLPV